MMKKFNNRPNKCHIIDGKEVWESRSPAIVGVILAKFDNEIYVLVGQRGLGAADNQGYWNVPCGYLDWDESGPEATIREIYEETGLDLEKIFARNQIHIIQSNFSQPFYVTTKITENRQNVSFSYGVFFYCEDLPELTTKYSETNEIAEAKWININDIDKYEFAYKHDQRIRMYLDNVL